MTPFRWGIVVGPFVWSFAVLCAIGAGWYVKILWDAFLGWCIRREPAEAKETPPERVLGDDPLPAWRGAQEAKREADASVVRAVFEDANLAAMCPRLTDEERRAVLRRRHQEARA